MPRFFSTSTGASRGCQPGRDIDATSTHSRRCVVAASHCSCLQERGSKMNKIQKVPSAQQKNKRIFNLDCSASTAAGRGVTVARHASGGMADESDDKSAYCATAATAQHNYPCDKQPKYHTVSWQAVRPCPIAVAAAGGPLRAIQRSLSQACRMGDLASAGHCLTAQPDTARMVENCVSNY